jgi:hypothetical protein
MGYATDNDLIFFVRGWQSDARVFVREFFLFLADEEGFDTLFGMVVRRGGWQDRILTIATPSSIRPTRHGGEQAVL